MLLQKKKGKKKRKKIEVAVTSTQGTGHACWTLYGVLGAVLDSALKMQRN